MDVTDNEMDGKQRAIGSLAIAAAVFFRVACAELEKRHPGRGRQNADLLEAGQAHCMISFQFSLAECRAALAMVHPEFVDVLQPAEMRLAGSIGSIFSDPGGVEFIDLGKLN